MSTTQAQDSAISTSISVDAPVERAFETFTAGIGSWWPAEHHILDAELGNLERHGEGWEKMRDAVGSPDGWGLGMRAFAQRLSA
jgi:uncharacterized protein YndB with AHSA1/START domain